MADMIITIIKKVNKIFKTLEGTLKGFIFNTNFLLLLQ